MSLFKKLSASLALIAVSLLVGCEPPAVEPELSMTAAPRTLDGASQKSILTLTATDTKGAPGTGTVRVTSTVGSLKDGVELTLAAGTATGEFTCNRTVDAACTGTVKLTAEWVVGGKLVSVTTSVTVTPEVIVDAGVVDAGFDAGIVVVDAGVDAGARLPDGGLSDYAISLSTTKTNLVAGAPDSTDVVVRLFTNTVGMLPTADTVTLTLSNGASFNPSAAQAMTTVMTAPSTGAATITVHPGTAVGNFTLSATGRDAMQTLTLRALNVQNIAWKNDTSTLTVLNIASTGINTTSQVFFEVRDSANNPVEGVEVSFAVAAGSAAGCSVAPTRATTNMMGVVRTTLSSGDSNGVATVNATVLGLPSASSQPFTINIGRPSDERLQVTCDRKTLGALQTVQPPRTDLTTICRANFSDRNGVRPSNVVQVAWANESGQIDAMSVGMPGTGLATANFTTSGNLPVATSPLVGEPSNGLKNPRDGFVSIIAAMSGEEQFWDGSGSSNGVLNGKWDPGEWFVDLPEPFVDSNDNGVFDPGERFIDTDRVDCTTGMNLQKNNQWDGPNGCWDSNTQIWATTHVVYAGGLAGGSQNSIYVTVQPPVPSFVLAGAATTIHSVVMTDDNFNRLSSDSPTAAIFNTFGTRGSMAVTNSSLGGESFGGHTVTYTRIRATENTPGVFTREGTCDQTIPDAGYPKTRCFKVVDFGPWMSTSSGVTVSVTSAALQSPLPDGGPAPATQSGFDLRVGNSLQASPSSVPFIISFQ